MKTVMKTLLKVAKWGLVGLTGLTVVLTVAVIVLKRRTYDVPTPAIAASKDPAVIARGKYLAYGPAHCVDCHGTPGAAPASEITMSGGMAFRLPVGTFRTANITSDPETGIGQLSDGQIARSLRHGVGRDGRSLMPFMPFANLSDQDLTAVISFLRTLPPVRHQVETREPNLLGHAIMAFFIKPEGPSGPVPARVPADASAEYGKYLVHNVAHCMGCHTVRDLRTGAYTGPMLAGGFDFVSDLDPKVHFISPNLTPDAKTGKISNWTEEIFMARFRTGKGAEGSPMPWKSFANISDSDLQAIYRYLKTVPAVHNDTGDSVRGPALTAQAN